MEVIRGKVEYEIIRTIASGGMGSVLKAREKGIAGFEKLVAIKKLLPAYSKDRMFVEMFIKEAKLVANLVHENIVQIYQLDKSGDEYYFVLEHVNGISLHQLIDFHHTMRISFPVHLAVFIASRVARGLAYAHSRCDAKGVPLDIVHCDICPNNILITTEGLPKITDFGIARARSANSQQNLLAGKVMFMSPEQAAMKTVDFRSDIYSLGVVLFYMLTGKPARHIGENREEALQKAVENQVLWERLPGEIDEDLRGILHRMLATDPKERFASTAELARELEYYIYKDGYGPTIVVLAEYMRQEMPGIFVPTEDSSAAPEEPTMVLTGKRVPAAGSESERNTGIRRISGWLTAVFRRSR